MKSRAKLKRSVRAYASELRAEFSREIARDERAFKKRVVRLIKDHLPPGPGRPPGQAITRAADLRRKGKTWQQIYAVCLLDAPDQNSRRIAQWQLRDAVRKRLGVRRRREKRRADFSARKTPRTISPSFAALASPVGSG